MKLEPRLLETSTPAYPRGAVLVLHGGARRREKMMVSPTQLSVLRMIPIARRIARSGQDQLAVFRLLNSRRGWDTQHTPVDDVRWAIARVGEIYDSSLPITLVGHSLGGRAALLTAGAPEVKSAVALAPWVYPTDVANEIDDKHLLFVHGLSDRIARPERSAALARALSRQARVGFIGVRGGKHAMLARHREFDRTAADFVEMTLLCRPPSGVLERIERGGGWVEV